MRTLFSVEQHALPAPPCACRAELAELTETTADTQSRRSERRPDRGLRSALCVMSALSYASPRATSRQDVSSWGESRAGDVLAAALFRVAGR
jgi:hypothetical protein